MLCQRRDKILSEIYHNHVSNSFAKTHNQPDLGYTTIQLNQPPTYIVSVYTAMGSQWSTKVQTIGCKPVARCLCGKAFEVQKVVIKDKKSHGCLILVSSLNESENMLHNQEKKSWKTIVKQAMVIPECLNKMSRSNNNLEPLNWIRALCAPPWIYQVLGGHGRYG